MTTSADIGYDSEFAIEGGTPGVYVKVAGVVSITPPGVTRETIDVTELESPDAYREFIGGLWEGGEASITVNYVPSETDVLFAALNAASGKYQITFPNLKRLRFSGICTGWNPSELAPASVMQLTATFKVTEKPTLLAAA